MSASQDFVALDWIKADIAQTLNQAQHALEAVAESADDASSMRACLTALHQVHGTLKMVEIEGPTLIASEMEALAQSLMNSDVPDVGHAQELLMQTILQMPGYLDRIQREQNDNPQFVAPTVNNLRVSRGEEKLFAEDEHAGEDVASVFSLAPTDDVVANYVAENGPATMRKLRQRYHQSLVSLLKKQSPRESLAMMARVMQKQAKICGESPAGYFAQLIIALIEGVLTGGFKLDATTANLLKRVDGTMKTLAEGEPSTLSTPLPEGLVEDLHQQLDAATKRTPKIEAALKLFASGTAPQTVETEKVDFGPDDETVATVSRIIIEELNGVTDKLDLYVRSSARNKQDIVDLLEPMEQIASTLMVVGKTNHQQSIAEQIVVLKEIESSSEDPSEDQLLSIAGALLEIHADLNRLVGDVDEDGEADTFGDLDEAQAAVVRETRVGLAHSKDAVIEYISNDFSKDKLETLAQNLRNLGGGLSIVNQQRSADVLSACSRYVDNILMVRTENPELADMDDLADAITSIDYFLERLLENAKDPYWQMVEVAEAAIAKLGFDVNNPDADPVAQAEDLEAPEALQSDAGNESDELDLSMPEVVDQIEESEVAANIEVPDTAAEEEADDDAPTDSEATDQLVTISPTISEPEQIESAVESIDEIEEEDELVDDDILEIFIEEAEEVLETIQEYLPKWQSDIEDVDARAEVRRAFHTLKGSGRMVGASVVGELAWSVENMLNRAIDNTIEITPALLEFIAEVVEHLPAGVEAFKNKQQHEFTVADSLAARADAIAAGQQVQAPAVEDEPIVEDSLSDQDLQNDDNFEAQESEVDTAVDDDSFEIETVEQVADIEAEDVESLADAVDQLEALEIEDPGLIEESSAITEDVSLETIEPETLSVEEGLIEISESDADFDLGELEIEETDSGEAELEALETLEELESIVDDAEATSHAADFDLEDVSSEEVQLEETDLGEVDAVDEISESAEAADIELEAFDFELATEDETVAESPTEASDTFALDELEIDDQNKPGDQAESSTAESIYDEELDEIFVEEAAVNLATIRAFVEQSPSTMQPEVIAAFHTLKGSAGMAEIPTIARIAAPMENLSNAMHNSGQEITETYFALARNAVALIQTVIDDLSTYRSDFAEADGFATAAEKYQSDLGSIATKPAFDFRLVVALSKPAENIRSWDQEAMALILHELEVVENEASDANQHDLVLLASKLRSIYLEIGDRRPASHIIEQLVVAHESLVIMFDQIASSQTVEPVPELMAALEALDLSAEVEEVSDIVEDEIEFEPEVDARQDQVIEPETDQVPEEVQSEVVEPVRTTPGTTPGTTAGTRLPADEIDEDVLALFLEEAEELVEAIDESILTWSEDPTSTAHLDNLLRHLHTMKGGARLAGINSLGEFTHNFETYLIGVQLTPERWDDDFFAVLNQRSDEITRRVEIYNKLVHHEATAEELASMQFDMPISSEIAPEIEAATAVDSSAAESEIASTVAAPEVTHLPADEVDEEVLSIFIEEAEELLEAIDESILGWSQSPEGDEFHDLLLRHLHTLKGGARLAGLNSLGEYTHNFETYLIGLQQNPIPIDENFFALLNQRQDEITRRVHIYQKLVQGEASDAELASLTEVVDDTGSSVDAVVAQASGPDSTEAAPAVETPTQTEAPETARPAASGNQEMVRVSSDLLEQLISLAGESNITRGRVEQQISDFGESLQEMEETINRVREQVRRLEIEAESRETVFRHSQRDSSGDSAFDDLEMDRYTMLQEISRTLNESSSDMLDLKETLVNKSRDAETLLHQQARIGTELQEGLTRTRMVPFARLIPRLRRIVRQVSNEVGKSVRFDAFNVEGELDRNVLERIVAPLEHMLRNAVDHGIESKDKRLSVNKPETGRISLRLSREGGYVVLTISDDGGGINVDAVREKAIERGLMTEDSDLSDHDVMQFIMHAGFSTAQQLTQISGRGVGMDVVNSEIKQLGGSISIDSKVGIGSEFTIHIPFTVSINRALMVVVKEETYAIPLNTIEGIVRVSPYELEAYYQPDAPMFEYAGQPYRLAYMGKLLEKSDDPALEGLVAPLPVILARTADHSVALQVDRVIGSREIVSKSLGAQFNDVVGVSGATVLGDGNVVVILDVLAFIRRVEESALIAPGGEKQEVDFANRVLKVMIVDDSVTVRKVTSRLMERQGWEVVTAKDGVDAMNQLQDIYPDIVLLDIEMPKMDGFEVLRSVRRDPRLAKLPIIMITSRTGEKHKQQALELGVNQYLGKPFQEANLLSTIEEVLEAASENND